MALLVSLPIGVIIKIFLNLEIDELYSCCKIALDYHEAYRKQIAAGTILPNSTNYPYKLIDALNNIIYRKVTLITADKIDKNAVWADQLLECCSYAINDINIKNSHNNRQKVYASVLLSQAPHIKGYEKYVKSLCISCMSLSSLFLFGSDHREETCLEIFSKKRLANASILPDGEQSSNRVAKSSIKLEPTDTSGEVHLQTDSASISSCSAPASRKNSTDLESPTSNGNGHNHTMSNKSSIYSRSAKLTRNHTAFMGFESFTYDASKYNKKEIENLRKFITSLPYLRKVEVLCPCLLPIMRSMKLHKKVVNETVNTVKLSTVFHLSDKPSLYFSSSII